MEKTPRHLQKDCTTTSPYQHTKWEGEKNYYDTHYEMFFHNVKYICRGANKHKHEQ